MPTTFGGEPKIMRFLTCHYIFHYFCLFFD
ncbi:hypothetical protein [Staphylococcus aureus]